MCEKSKVYRIKIKNQILKRNFTLDEAIYWLDHIKELKASKQVFIVKVRNDGLFPIINDE